MCGLLAGEKQPSLCSNGREQEVSTSSQPARTISNVARPQPTASATFSQPALHENSHVRSRSLPGPVDDVEDDGGESHLERTNRPESRLHLVEEERFVDDTVRGSDTSADAERPVDRPAQYCQGL